MGKICYFAGHRTIYGESELYERVYKKAEELVLYHAVTDFWVGRYGSFDEIATRVADALRKKYTVKLTLIIPYLTVDIDKDAEKFYDDIIIAQMPQNTPKRYRILKCNEYAARNADFLLCYVAFGFGGAAKTLKYARRNGVGCVNLSVM